MNDKNLKRLIRLAQRTGDRLIVAGEDNEEPMVIMGLTDYEVMHDLITISDADGFDEGEDFDESDFDESEFEVGAYDDLDAADEIPVGAFREMPTGQNSDDEEEFELPEAIFAPMPGEVAAKPDRDFVLEEIVSDESEVKKVEIQPSESSGYDNEEQFYLEPIE